MPPTTARDGKGDAYEFCKSCHPGAIAPIRTRDWARGVMQCIGHRPDPDQPTVLVYDGQPRRGLHFGCGEIRGSVNEVPERSRAPQPLGGPPVSRSESNPACED